MNRRSTWLFALVPVFLWGTSFAAAKIALAAFSPVTITFGRAALAMAAIAIAAPLLPVRSDRPARGDGPTLLLLALMGVVAQTWLQSQALLWTTVQNSGWLVTMIPLFTAVLSAAFLGERFPLAKIAGTAVGLSGALIVVASRGASLALPATRGDLLILASALNWAVYTLVARRLLARRSPIAITLRTLAIGTPLLAGAFLLLGDPGEFVRAGAGAWAALVYLGVGCTAAGWICWATALERLEPGTLTSFQYLQPLVTVASAALLLGESIRLHAILGGALALAGVALVQRAAGRA
ncbi:MAG TPA: DMT family transporter [Candidatus Polarisedimenticolaceae bacterium]